jgi:hypothetical protein
LSATSLFLNALSLFLNCAVVCYDRVLGQVMEVLRQVSRYFNCELFFEEENVIALIRGLATVPKAARIEFFETAVRSRRRDRMDWRGTDVEAVFVHSDERKLVSIRP